MDYCIERSLTLSNYALAWGKSIDGNMIMENLWNCAARALDIKEDDHILVELPQYLLVEEVLTRLPAKSLMRFKSVSKLNPCFAKAHNARSRSASDLVGDLLVVCTASDRVDSNYSFNFFHATPSEGDFVSETVHQFTVYPHNCDYDCHVGVLEEVVDVLHCYDENTAPINGIVG